MFVGKEQKKSKIAVPLKYLRNFLRSLEMPLINSKVELSLRWIESCMLTAAAIGDNANATGADSAAFVTLSTQANENYQSY